MRHALPAIALGLALAACNASTPAGNAAAGGGNTTLPSANPAAESGSAAATPGNAAEQAQAQTTASSIVLRPGQWENKFEILDVQMAGAPPGMLEGMKRRPQSVTSCMTAEQAAMGPRSEMLGKGGCHFNHYEAAGGHISSEMVCPSANSTLTTRSTGTYTATDYSVDGEANTTGKMAMTMKTRVTGHWVGACTGKEGVKQ